MRFRSPDRFRPLSWLKPGIRKILNHVERDVTAVYDRYSYDAEKKAALEEWSSIPSRIAIDKQAIATLDVINVKRYY